MDEKLSSTEFYAYLIQQGIISKKQLSDCMKIQQELRTLGLEQRSLLAILLEKKYLTREQIAEITNTSKQESSGTPQIPGYRLVKKIGQGGMGSVYLARQISMERDVAIKILSQKMVEDKYFVARFYREARASAALNHPNIVSGIDVGETNGFYYFVMEHIQGQNIADLLENGPVSESLALKIVRQVAMALDHAHQINMVHRDIKPDNLILTKNEVVKLLDFGLAKKTDGNAQLTRIGTTMGTPSYVSPEQASGEKTDIRSDIYSLGATFFHLATGQTPFSGKNALVIMTKHINNPVPDPCKINPKINGNVGKLILKMMEKDRSQRFQTPKELIQALDSVEESLSQNSSPTSSPKKNDTAKREHATKKAISNTHFSSETLESIPDELLISSEEFSKEVRIVAKNSQSAKALPSFNDSSATPFPTKNSTTRTLQTTAEQEKNSKNVGNKTKKNIVTSDAIQDFHKKVTAKNIRSTRKKLSSNWGTNFIFLSILSVTGLFLYHHLYSLLYGVESPLPSLVAELFLSDDLSPTPSNSDIPEKNWEDELLQIEQTLDAQFPLEKQGAHLQLLQQVEACQQKFVNYADLFESPKQKILQRLEELKPLYQERFKKDCQEYKTLLETEKETEAQSLCEAIEAYCLPEEKNILKQLQDEYLSKMQKK